MIGLGYVGLPLAVEFGKQRPVIGFDVNEERIAELKNYIDKTRETDIEQLRSASSLVFTSEPEDLVGASVYIVTVPTPIDENKSPDLSAIRKASEIVGYNLACGDIVVYESTVYPGCTREVCVPILEQASGLSHNIDFFTGYSPERINPGDKKHTLTNIVKVTSGSTVEAADEIDNLYKTIIAAGTHRAPSIEVAEAAKVIENTQRDINIALVNELAIIFDRIQVDVLDVLEAAGTKWNFLNFSPGLVGGHCIGVDPYYLAHKAQMVGYDPAMILAGRRVNESVPSYIATKVVKEIARKSASFISKEVLIIGFTFKENCPDFRNTKVAVLVSELRDFGCVVDIYDPVCDVEAVFSEYDLGIESVIDRSKSYAAIVIAVPHTDVVLEHYDWIREQADNGTVVYDLKGVMGREVSCARV